MSGSAASDLAARIDALLPQTQCTRCGFSGCRPYAEAVASGAAQFNRCPPGGTAVLEQLAALLGKAPLALDPAVGVAGDPRVAWIDESRCIGCARCLPPCPVDAIVGAQKYLHTVLAERCTGCELCLPPCPVDCIELRPSARPVPSAELNRARHHAHVRRAERRSAQRAQELAAIKAAARSAE